SLGRALSRCLHAHWSAGAHVDTATGAPTSGPARPRQRPIKAGSETGAPLRVIPLVAGSRCARITRIQGGVALPFTPHPKTRARSRTALFARQRQPVCFGPTHPTHPTLRTGPVTSPSRGIA